MAQVPPHARKGAFSCIAMEDNIKYASVFVSNSRQVCYNRRSIGHNDLIMEVMNMQVHIFRNAEEVAKAAAMIFAAEISRKPDAVIGLATGSTPVPTYQELIRLNREGLIDFSKVRSYNLDEYIGLEGTHECSYRYFMNDQLFNHINIDMANTHVPCGTGADHEADAAAYDAAIEAAGGVDLQLLGIGHNGHIGFNEPNTHFVYPTNIIDLTESTINANARYFDSANDVPRQAISMGIGTIMAARRVILLATGKGKAPAIARAVKGQIDPDMPASILRAHQNCQFLLDEEAASEL